MQTSTLESSRTLDQTTRPINRPTMCLGVLAYSLQEIMTFAYLAQYYAGLFGICQHRFKDPGVEQVKLGATAPPFQQGRKGAGLHSVFCFSYKTPRSWQPRRSQLGHSGKKLGRCRAQWTNLPPRFLVCIFPHLAHHIQTKQPIYDDIVCIYLRNVFYFCKLSQFFFV